MSKAITALYDVKYTALYDVKYTALYDVKYTNCLFIILLV